jgi:SAM-dependent methyltransferase
MNVQRTHDSLYLQESHREEPKEYFKFIADRAGEFIKRMVDGDAIDIGCATGDFLWYMSKLFPDCAFSGLDVRADLIDKAKRDMPNVTFYVGDIFAGTGLPDKQFDMVFMNSVHMIFDDHAPWLDNCLKLCKTGGGIFVFGMFNPDPVDVLVKARPATSEGAWEAGWNVLSHKTMLEYCKKRNCGICFERWEIPIDIIRRASDPLRGWTIKKSNGYNIITNGTCVIQYTYLCEIVKNEPD